jgi:serine/threonine-protein kinase
MAEVFEGRDRLLARRVAIKVLQAQFARDPSFLIRFKREAQAAASLSHPNIVGVYDTGTEDGTHFIVMEYVDGRTLKEVDPGRGPAVPRARGRDLRRRVQRPGRGPRPRADPPRHQAGPT